MRISDWSSDVCSSDLVTVPNLVVQRTRLAHGSVVAPLRDALVACAFDLVPIFLAEQCWRQSLPASPPADAVACSAFAAAVSPLDGRSEEHTSELQSLMRISYAVFCLTKKKMKP